jgi:hypothetical protein
LFPKEQSTSPGERSKFLEETYVPNLLAIIAISYLFLYSLVTYHSKGFEEMYNFVVEELQFKLTCKSYDHTKFQTHLFPEGITPPGTRLALGGAIP